MTYEQTGLSVTTIWEESNMQKPEYSSVLRYITTYITYKLTDFGGMKMCGVGLSGGISFVTSFVQIDPLVQNINSCRCRQPKFFLYRKENWLNTTSDNHSFVECHTLPGVWKYRMGNSLLWVVTV